MIYINLEHSRLSQLRVVKKVRSLVALSFTFWKTKSLETFPHGIFAEVGLPYFQGHHFQCWNQGARRPKNNKKHKTKNSPWPKKKSEYFFYWLYIISLSAKSSCKMPTFWNYLAICPCFKTWFTQNGVSM